MLNEMEVWDKDFPDLMGPACITINFEPDGSLTGEIRLDDGGESEFRAAPWDSSTAC